MGKNEKDTFRTIVDIFRSLEIPKRHLQTTKVYPIPHFCHRLTGHRPFWNLSHQCLSPPFMSHRHLLIALCALKVTGLPQKQIGLHLVEEKRRIYSWLKNINIENWIFISTSPPTKKDLHLKILHCNLTVPLGRLDSCESFFRLTGRSQLFQVGHQMVEQHKQMSEAPYSSPTSLVFF